MTDKDTQNTEEEEEEMDPQTMAAEATGDIFAILNDDAYKKLEDIYKQILYRSFYFPGGTPKKRIRGVGTDTSELEYDQDPTALGSSGTWDPRYLDDYIERAKMEGFHKNFLYVRDGSVKTISFSEAAQELRGCFQLGQFKSDRCDKSRVISIIVGMRYMNKIKAFITEFGSYEDLDITEKDMKDLLTYAPQEAYKYESLLQSLIGQTRSEFINNNYGWVADYREDLAFDRGKFAATYMEEKKKFQEYADKLWGILQNVKALNLCANIDRSINQGENITHTQKNKCILNIKNEMAAKNMDGKTSTNDDEGDNAEDAEKQKQLEEEKKKLEEQQQALKKQMEDIKKQQQESESKSNQKIDDMMKKLDELNKKQEPSTPASSAPAKTPSTPASSAPPATPAKTPAKEPETNNTKVIIIVVSSVVGLILFGIILFLVLGKRSNRVDNFNMYQQNNMMQSNAQNMSSDPNVGYNTMNSPMRGGYDVIVYE